MSSLLTCGVILLLHSAGTTPSTMNGTCASGWLQMIYPRMRPPTATTMATTITTTVSPSPKKTLPSSPHPLCWSKT
ncbi:hypothetical protein FB451DRAFT_1305469 [Mycena latifolia]|nr:hypothetical protein FB451DRAFT_1305469 [Mycena latifolia]